MFTKICPSVNALTEGHILVNKKPVKANYRVKPLDDITVELPYPPQEIELIPEDIPLNILYEDDDVIVLNKDASLLSTITSSSS